MKKCSVCKELTDKYSNCQLKMKEKRKCRNCVEKLSVAETTKSLPQSEVKAVEPEEKIADLIECYICHNKFKCSCLTEDSTKLKYRSCALRQKTYPQSQFCVTDSGVLYIHICSKGCANKLAIQLHCFFASKGFTVHQDFESDSDTESYGQAGSDSESDK